jgi:hypothetical protein
VSGGRSPPSAWRPRLRDPCGPAGGGRVPPPSTRRGRCPSPRGLGRAREVVCPCRGGASASRWSRYPHATGVVQGAHRGCVVLLAVRGRGSCGWWCGVASVAGAESGGACWRSAGAQRGRTKACSRHRGARFVCGRRCPVPLPGAAEARRSALPQQSSTKEIHTWTLLPQITY